MDSKYIVRIGGHSWAVGPSLHATTLSEARETIKQYGTTADYADVIRHRDDKLIEAWRRSTEGYGMRWYKAVPG